MMPRADGVPRTTILEIMDLLQERRSVGRRIEFLDRISAEKNNPLFANTITYRSLIESRNAVDQLLASVPDEQLQAARVAIRLGMVHTSETFEILRVRTSERQGAL